MSEERSWVWVASTETVRDGKVSLLACAETVLMVSLYWAIAWVFDTHLHLLAGLLVMPLMLFRSGESVALGVKWGRTFRMVPADFFTIVVYIGVVTFAGLIAIGLIALWSLNVSVLTVPLFCLLFTTLALAFQLKLPTGPLRYLERSSSGLGFYALFAGCGIFPLFFAQSAFYFVAPLVFRFTASALYFKKGFSESSKNWRRIVLYTDSGVLPEPLPHPKGEVSDWSPEKVLGDFRQNFKTGNNVGPFGLGVQFPLLNFLTLLLMSPTFLTAILFRWALKSTAWFYLPLLFLTKPFDGQSRLIWMRSFPRTVLTWVRLILSLICIAVALAAMIVDLPSALKAMELGRAMELPFQPLSLVLVLKWDPLHPWQYASLPTAILTVVLFFRLDQLGRQEQAGAVIAEGGFALTSMVWADRIRSVCAIAWLALITPPTLRFFHCAGQLPVWAARPLGALFQPGACKGIYPITHAFKDAALHSSTHVLLPPPPPL